MILLRELNNKKLSIFERQKKYFLALFLFKIMSGAIPAIRCKFFHRVCFFLSKKRSFLQSLFSCKKKCNTISKSFSLLSGLKTRHFDINHKEGMTFAVVKKLEI